MACTADGPMDLAFLVVMRSLLGGCFMRFLGPLFVVLRWTSPTCCLQAFKAENLSTPSTNCPKRTHTCLATPVARMIHSGIVAIGDATVESFESWSMVAFLDPTPVLPLEESSHGRFLFQLIN